MLSQIRTHLADKLKDRNYRHKFFKGRAEDEVASKLIEFRKGRHLSQAALARLCGMKQSAISRIERASYSRWNFTTLWRIAKALDVRVQIIFTDMADVLREYERRESTSSVITEVVTNEAIQDPASASQSGLIPVLPLPVSPIPESVSQGKGPQSGAPTPNRVLSQDAVSSVANSLVQ